MSRASFQALQAVVWREVSGVMGFPVADSAEIRRIPAESKRNLSIPLAIRFDLL
ncbi:MAG: hypothetical protein LBF60_01705 [Treponema sp.]|nr:hypothetical protein [Treponema sp.]